MLEDYCRYGIDEKSAKEVTLLCPPTIESLIYLAPIKHVTVSVLTAIPLLVMVMRGRQHTGKRAFLDFFHSIVRSDIAEHFSNITDIQMNDVSHFIPMEKPHLVANILNEQIDDESSSFGV